ncbi:MAG: hypothetical protein NTX50_22125 [Candidatus Sumerlaeota bacterium]|nr:hypothetical protein [Candidatus Sumerlaeota bacterium]
MIFDTREEAADWIDKNQLGRRNLAHDAISNIRGRIYNRTKKSVGKPAGTILGQSEPISSAEKLGKEFGVSADTIKRDGQFAAAVETLKPVVPDIEKRVMAGTAPTKAAKTKRLNTRFIASGTGGI